MPTAGKASSAGWCLAVITLLNLLNYVDRYVVSALVETLKRSELRLSDSQAGLLMTAFIAVYTVTFPIFGYYGDRLSRPNLLAFGVLVWSLATVASGFATDFPTLLACRALVGIGEAAYVTVAPTLIADLFPAAKSGKAYAIFFAAIPIGSAIGYVLGGVLDTHFGWHQAFLFTGLPGLVLAVAAWRLVDPPRRKAGDDGTETGAISWRTLLTKPSPYLLASLGYAAYAFGLGALAFWLPAYMERVRGSTHEDAAVATGAMVVVTGFLGTFLGGFVADALRRRRADADMLVCWASVAVCVPLLLIALLTGSMPIFWASLAAAELAIFMSSGPVNGAVIASLPVPARTMGLALCNVITHIFGDVPSPPLVGWLSDRSSLQTALLLVPLAFVICTGFWFAAARYTQRQTGLKPTA